MNITTELTFETAIVQALVERGGYSEGDRAEYSTDLGMFREDVIQFLQTSQPERWERVEAIHGKDVENRILQRLYKELDLRNSLDVLRNGFVDYGVRFQLVYFRPASTLNPDAVALYNTNRLKVYRQVRYGKESRHSVDLVLSLNGIPVATLELKNQFTRQNAEHAKKQYSSTRDNKELLFAFKKRALVHFAVDQDEVFMTTKIDGDKTIWLPFNKGWDNGKGNPPVPDNYRTAYLWDDILQKDSWMEIIQRFIHIQTEEVEIDNRVIKKEKLIFPRFHQLDAVRKISSDVLSAGVGKDYLIQHSAGSGKSNTIAWLAYRLSSLHNAQDQRMFDSVIVISDRNVLDQQLQDTIYQFEHKTGVVQKIDKDSAQLAKALEAGVNIIVTTLQKFPFVIGKIGALPQRQYAVVIDEAHSSQGGENATKMKEVLSAKSLEEAVEKDQDESVTDNAIQQAIKIAADARGKQAHISCFAFTATPKADTLQDFGYKDAEGKPRAFHLYSMRQAIEEGFILNVLQNYTTYELYFRLTKAIEDDPKLSKRKTAKSIGKYISLHPHNLAQKTEIIIEHFRNIVAKKIGGRAKAMLVCGSRLHAKRYFEAFKEYIHQKGYQNEVKVLVAFSGRVVDDNFPDGVSEPELTGFGEKELPTVFSKDEYRILIVAEKYQTGFDQPLLHTMYVDKQLSGVKAVQTLSRLNRTCVGKEDTFVLDFVNDRNTILDAFQPYYETTTVTQSIDVNHLYDLKGRLDEFQVYWESEINTFARIYFDPNVKLANPRQQKYLYACTDPAVDRFKAIDREEEQDEFRKGLRTWTNLYAFLAQIMPFVEPEFEKFYAYAKFLQTRLPKRNLADSLQIQDEIALEYYRLQKIKEGAIVLAQSEDGEISSLTEAGLTRAEDEEAHLSEIITVLNKRFGTEFEEADKLFFEQIEAELMQDEALQVQARVNKLDTFKYAFDDLFLTKLVERMEQNQEIFEKLLEDKDFGDLVKELMMKKVYRKINEAS